MDKEDVLDKRALIREVFKGLDEAHLEEIALLTKTCCYPADTVLCHEGTQEDRFYIIASGTVEISQQVGSEAEVRILGHGEKGDIVGEMGLIHDAPRTASVRTTSECQLLEMDKQEFETLLSHNPGLAVEIIEIAQERLRDNDMTGLEELFKADSDSFQS